MQEIYYLQGQRKIIRRKLFKFSIYFLIVGLFVGVGLGMAWRMAQERPEMQAQQAKIQNLQKTIEYYRSNWTPIKQKEILKSKEGAGKKGK